MEFVELKKHIKSGKAFPCYVCAGDDEYLVEHSVTLISALASEPKPFNISDKEFDSAADMTAELMQLPLIGEYRVVVARGKYDVAAVEKYLQNPNASAVLVLPSFIPHDSWNRSASAVVPSGATLVDCNRLTLPYASAFIRSVAENVGASVDNDAAKLIYDRCGGYMTRINSEANKLAALRMGGNVTRADVEMNVVADAEFVVFELCDSILAGKAARALEVVNGMAKNNDLTAAFTLLYNRFKRIFGAAVDPDGLSALGVKPYQITKLKSESTKFSKARLKKILDLLADADYAYKTGATSVFDALTAFVAQATYGGAN